MKYIVFISHCFFNLHSKVENHKKKAIEGEAEIRGKILSLFFENNIGVIQLPCPETICYGLKRWGHVKDQFNHVHYRKVCKEILTPHMEELDEYISNDCKLLGIIGIERSPSCGCEKTYRGPWKGEISGNPLFVDNKAEGIYLADEKGMMMEIFEEMLLGAGVESPVFLGYSPAEGKEFLEKLRNLIESEKTNG